MKKLLLINVLFFTVVVLHAQPWLKNLPVHDPAARLTLQDYRNAFESYWASYQVDRGYYMENGEKKKAPGWKQFKRWEHEMEDRVNPSTGEFPARSAWEIYAEYMALHPQTDQPAAANWTVLGPNSSFSGYSGTGRINCVAFHPSDNNTWWVGAASGGLWATTDNGSTWSCLTDFNQVLAVSDIVVPPDYAASQTIYIATGDKDHWDNRSVGVLKSTDGGNTWNTTGLNYQLSDYRMVNRLLMDPSNSQVLLAATSSGVYKTTNGGATWNTLLTSAVFIDMEYKPGNFSTLYGSTTQGEIQVSADGGQTWTQAWYNSSAYRTELAVSANQPNWVYAVTANSSSGLYSILKSTNSGALFSQVFSGTTKNLLGWDSGGGGTGGQGWYDLCLASAPSNANTLLVGGVNTWRSTNGGADWSIVNHWWGDGVQAVHADKHSLVYRSNGDLFECNDGGVYLSQNNGTNWTDKTNGLVISQMYKLGVSATVPDEVITGLQDNGTKLYASGTWDDVKGGDGMECLIDYTDVNIQYGTYVNGQISRTYNHWASSTAIEPSGAGSGAWVTPYIIDPADPLKLYAGYADVWKTINRGNSWTKISTMNTSDKIRSMAIAPSNNQVLYVADRTHIWKTTNGGGSWSDITGTLPASSYGITSIAVKNDDPATLWVALGGYSANRVYQSADMGATWSNISSGLPQVPAYSIVQNKQSSEVQLYLGTEVGVYFKKGSDDWTPYNTGLPNVKIGELEIFYHGDALQSKLRAATYGRGLWETPLFLASAPEVVTKPATEVTAISARLNGTINPNGLASTWYFEWGTSTSYGNTTAVASAGSGTATVAVSVVIDGLSQGTVYHFRLAGTSSAGTSYGTDKTFVFNSNAISKVGMGSSVNAFTFLVPEQTGMDYDPASNTLMATYRGDHVTPGYLTGNDCVASFSINGGISWTEKTAFTGSSTDRVRYPSGRIFNPAGSNSPESAYSVVAGPVTNGATWVKSFFGSRTYDGSQVNEQLVPTPTATEIFRNGMVITDNGISSIGQTVNTTDGSGYTSLTMETMRGTWNEASNAFTWSQVNVDPQPYIYFDASKGWYRSWASYYNACFARDGSVGYMWTDGVDARATNGSSFYPIIFKTTDGGVSWSVLNYYDFGQLPEVSDHLYYLAAQPGRVSPWFHEMDGVVDNAGNLHLFALCKSAYSVHPDSLTYYWVGEKGSVFEFEYNKTSQQWTALWCDSLRCGEVTADITPYTNGTDVVGWNHRLQASVNPGGTRVFASWTDTDPEYWDLTEPYTDLYPDLKTWGRDLFTGLYTNPKNITFQQEAMGECFFHYLSPTAIDESGFTTLPVRISDIQANNYDPADPVFHYYLKGVLVDDAEFVNTPQGLFVITTASSPPEGGTTSGGGSYTSGQQATVTATQAANYTFTGWTENGNVVSTDASYTFTVTSNRNLVAGFSSIASYTVTTSPSPANGGTTSGGGTYTNGQQATVTAMPAANWIFVDWTENGTQVSVDPEYTFTVTGNRELTANFVETFLITATANPTEGGYIQGEGTYPAGSLVILQAYANSDFSFYAWTENGVPVSSSASYTFTASANRNLVAGFLPTVNVEETAGGISIYPNPVSGTLYLRTSPGASSGIKTVWLSDPEGRCVFERTTGGSSHEMTVDVSPFAPGFYLVRIMLVDGTMTNARVVVVK